MELSHLVLQICIIIPKVGTQCKRETNKEKSEAKKFNLYDSLYDTQTFSESLRESIQPKKKKKETFS